MTTEQAWLGATCAAATALAVLALVLALRARRRAARAEAIAASLADRISRLEAPAASAPPAVDDGTETFVITRMDDDVPEAPVPIAREIDGRLFADIVAREAVVKAASWTHGLRRALSAQNRNRIRFEVRQETRRAGRDRRAEAKQALREYRARERSAGRHRVEVREDVA